MGNLFQDLYNLNEASTFEIDIKKSLKNRSDISNSREGGRIQVGRYKLEIQAKTRVVKFVVTAGKGSKKFAFYGTEIDYLKSQGYECTDGNDYVYEKTVIYDTPELKNTYSEIEKAIDMIKNQSIGSLYSSDKSQPVAPVEDKDTKKEIKEFNLDKFIEAYESRLLSNGFYKVNYTTYVLEVAKWKDKNLLHCNPQITLKLSEDGIKCEYHNSEFSFKFTSPGEDILKIFKSIMGQVNSFILDTRLITDTTKIDTFLGKLFSWINTYVSETRKQSSNDTQTLKTNLGGIWIYKEQIGKVTRASIELKDDVIKDLVSKGVTEIQGNFLSVEDTDGDKAIKKALGILSQNNYTGKARVLVKNTPIQSEDTSKDSTEDTSTSGNVDMKAEVKPKMDKVSPEQKDQLTRIYNYAKKQLDLVNANPEINFIYLEEPKEIEFHKLPTVGLMLYTYDMDKKSSDLMKDSVVKKFNNSKTLKKYKLWHKTTLKGKSIQAIIFIDAIFARENNIRGLLKESLEVDSIVFYKDDFYIVSEVNEGLCSLVNESKELKDISIDDCLLYEE